MVLYVANLSDGLVLSVAKISDGLGFPSLKLATKTIFSSLKFSDEQNNDEKFFVVIPSLSHLATEKSNLATEKSVAKSAIFYSVSLSLILSTLDNKLI